MMDRTISRTAASIAVFLLILFELTFSSSAETAPLNIRDLLKSQSLNGATVGMIITDLKTGETIYSQNADKMLIPASNMKLITGASAFIALGADFRFQTDFFLKDFNYSNGTAAGLYVKGYGDPTLKEKFYDTAGDGIAAVAYELKRAGLSKLVGVLWLDDSFFAGPNRPKDWDREDISWCYAPRTGALAVGGNCLKVKVTAGKAGTVPFVDLDPPVDPDYLTVKVTTIKKGTSKVKIEQKANGKITVTGKAREGAVLELEYPAPHPALLYGAALSGALKKLGVPTKVELKKINEVPDGYVQFRQALSTELKNVLAVMGKYSDNFVAEQSILTLGAMKTKGRTRSDGAASELEILRSNNIADERSIIIDDGSGLSRKNRLTPKVLMTLLGKVYNSYFKDDFANILATPGEEGTMKKRVPSMAGRLWAKTGALSGACALSGYYIRANGDPAAFTMIMNGYKVHSSEIRSLQDKIVLWMAEN